MARAALRLESAQLFRYFIYVSQRVHPESDPGKPALRVEALREDLSRSLYLEPSQLTRDAGLETPDLGTTQYQPSLALLQTCGMGGCPTVIQKKKIHPCKEQELDKK